MKYKLLLFTGVFLLAGWSVNRRLYAQDTDTAAFTAPVTIDEVVIRAQQNGFDIRSFIDLIRRDTTFYKAFRSMHLVSFNAENDIRVFDRNNKKIKASLSSETKQVYRNGCRTMNVLEEKTTGDFYKQNGDYRYYTAALYAQLFFTKGRVCGEDNIVQGWLDKTEKGKSRIEKSKTQLKYLMFNPGRPVPGVPFVSNKVAIFEPDIAEMYDFRLVAQEKNGVACYLFEARPKPEYKNDVVINVFRTWLRQSDYAIIARDYALSYKTMLYDFDVYMHVDLQKHGNQLLPAFISYSGNWHVLTKDREIVRFTARFDY